MKTNWKTLDIKRHVKNVKQTSVGNHTMSYNSIVFMMGILLLPVIKSLFAQNVFVLLSPGWTFLKNSPSRAWYKL
jgi:hypothetical protein